MTGTNVVEKKDEKVGEKRRALGRGLASLLPGPRVVPGGSGATRERNDVPAGLKTGAPVSSQRPSAMAPQGPKPGTSGEIGGMTEAKFPSSELSEGGVSPESAKGLGAESAKNEAPAVEEGEAKGAGASAPREHKLEGAAASVEVPLPANPAGSGAPQFEQTDGQPISIQAQAVGPNMVAALDISLVDKNPYQTRYLFDKELLEELAESIKNNGVVQPIVVRPGEDGRYLLVLGERRLRASKLAGKTTIPAIVRRLSLQQAAEMTVLENVQRQDLNAVEQAEAFRVLSLEFKLTQAQIAARIGVSRETVTNYMRLLRLPEEVMQMMLDGKLSFSDAREILSLDNDAHIPGLAQEVVEKHLKLDQIEERVRELNGFAAMQKAEGWETKAARRSSARWMDPNVKAAQNEMERTLGMRVWIKDRNGKGKITIEYATVDDYQRVTELLRGRK
jgi:ParB family transcriptional regulator, chromosome partitioning protein